MKINEICVIGLGQFGKSLIENLEHSNKTLIAIDINESEINKIKTHVDVALVGDATDESFLLNAKLQSVNAFVICMGNDMKSSILISAILLNWREKYKKDFIIFCKVVDKIHAEILEKLGIKHIINPEFDVGKTLAFKLTSNLYMSKIGVDMQIINENLLFVKIIIEKHNNWLVGKDPNSLSLLKEKNIKAIAIENSGGKSKIINEETRIEMGDIIYLIGDRKDIVAIGKKIVKDSGFLSKFIKTGKSKI